MSVLLGKNKNRPKAFERFHLNTYLVSNHVAVVNLVSNLLCGLYFLLKNSLIIHEENTKKNHKRVVSV